MRADDRNSMGVRLQMGKVKAFFQNMSIRASFVLYAVIALLLALLLYAVTDNIATPAILGSPGNPKLFVEESQIFLLNNIRHWSTPIDVMICVILAAVLFYRNKIARPVKILEEASGRIADNNLDFMIDCQGKDELGKVCASFEKMRGALAENNRLMWRQVEQRKSVNAAFAHDLRTPLTVLKGQLEMVRQGDLAVPEETVATMAKQIDRLERYVDSMGSLQKMEDIQPVYGCVDLQSLAQAIRQMTDLVCSKGGKQADFQNHATSEAAALDENMVFQVAENLVSNAARYAEDRVTISLIERDVFISISVHDDGNGFSAESKKRAAEPYYSADEDRADHFGLGLYVSKLLCALHGGDITIENDDTGATVTASFRIKAG